MNKYFQYLILLSVFGCRITAAAQTVQYVSLFATNIGNTSYAYSLPLKTKQIITLVGLSPTTLPVTGNMPSGLLAGQIQMNHSITGLTNVQFAIAGSGPWATFQITTPATATTVSNYVPADAIVIPASATGNVQIILESSTDLLNWTAASPGTYGASSTTNRFFRVRATVN